MSFDCPTISAFKQLVLLTFIYQFQCKILLALTHWGRVTHICVSKLTITGSDKGLSLGRRQAIIWTNDGILFIGPLRTNFNEILIFSFKKMRLKVLSAKRRPFCLGLNVLRLLVWNFHKNNLWYFFHVCLCGIMHWYIYIYIIYMYYMNRLRVWIWISLCKMIYE